MVTARTYALPDGVEGVVMVGEVSRPAQRGGRPGWRRLSAPGDKCGARWLHEAGAVR